jgi:MFS transporter, SP family, sugar:H+ symporter
LNKIATNHWHELTLDSFVLAFWFPTKRLFTGCAITALSQLTGINFIFYYGTQFFKNSGIQNQFLIGLTTHWINVASAIPGVMLVQT